MAYPSKMILYLAVAGLLALNGTSSVSARADVSQVRGAGAAGAAKTWGGPLEDISQATAVDSAGNVYVTGYFNGTVDFDPGSGINNHSASGGRDVFLSKLDASGSLVWARTWGGSGDDTGNGIAVDRFGNVFVSGRFQNTADFDPGSGVETHVSLSGVANDAFVSKFDSNGTFQWARTWGGTFGDEAYGVATDVFGNAYVVGDFSSPSVDFDPGAGVDSHVNSGMFDAFLSKFDPNGAFLWAKSWGGTLYDDGPRVVLDSAGNVYISGMFQSQPGDFDPGSGVDLHSANGSIDVFLSKFDTNGNFLWARTWGGTGDDCGEALAVDGSGNVYVTGYFSATVDFDPGSGVDTRVSSGDRDAFLSKLDTNGTYLWAKTWGGTGDDRAESIYLDGAGSLYLTGMYSGSIDFNPGSGVDFHTSNGATDVFLSKLDTSGTYLWARTWGGSGDDAGIGMSGHSLDRVYVTGWYSASADFSPWSGGEMHTSGGSRDAFLSIFTTFTYTNQCFLPNITR